MKRIVNTLIITAFSVLAFSCQERMEVEMPMNESIILDLSCGLTKADDNSIESYVNHLDVFIFNVDGTKPGTKEYYGRYNVDNASQISLNINRSSFISGQSYYVYLIANSILPEAQMSSMTNYDDLINMKQEDPNLHITGLTLSNSPKYFLMDAVAKDALSNSPVVLNNGVLSDNTELHATLKRAAAKVYVNITATENITFMPFGIEDGSEGGLYYIRNLSYDTFLLEEAKTPDQIEAKVRTTIKANNEYFTWNPQTNDKNVTLVTYVYPNHWADDSLLEHETCIVMNLPLSYTNGGVTTDHHNSWYKIPMTDEKLFQRNNYYAVNISLNRPGATSETTPIDLTDISYVVEDWVEKDIIVGGEDKPVYLMVNETEMEMHTTSAEETVTIDDTTLEFASSSPVTISVKDAYYYNKFGQRTNVSAAITGTTEGGIVGKITVSSPVPDNNAIRYFTLVVTNQDGLSREVLVTQYPLEYITNIQGWYSYRSDFGGTTYQNMGDRYVAADWDGGNWDRYTSQNDNYFFGSKVAEQYANGTSEIYRYYYSGYYGNYTLRQNVSSGIQNLDNARMYHVQITSTSGEYVLGIPERDPLTDYTLSDADNSKLVSPSFMIASQLGATTSTSSTNASYVARAQSHCSQYVETYFDDLNGNREWDEGEPVHHLDDWRLPTEAEIAIIVKFQTSSEVMDVVLGGANYFCASPLGYVATGVAYGNGKYTRCIRDVY